MNKRMKTAESAGMNPKFTEPPKKKRRKKPNPYRAPNTIKRYYAGIEAGIRILENDLLTQLEGHDVTKEELIEMIRFRSGRMIAGSKKKLIELEKQKTKERNLKWEEKEWESL